MLNLVRITAKVTASRTMENDMANQMDTDLVIILASYRVTCRLNFNCMIFCQVQPKHGNGPGLLESAEQVFGTTVQLQQRGWLTKLSHSKDILRSY